MSKIVRLFEDEGETVAASRKMGYTGSLRKPERGIAFDSRNDDWYTPSDWLNLARDVLGGIDLDPFSSERANQTVQAKRYFTEEDNAFQQKWKARTVWMNPPYTRGVVDKAVAKFLEEYRRGHFEAGLILVNNMTDTLWYTSMYEDAYALCNIKGRISFENAAGQRVSGNTRGQSLFLFARNDKSHNQIKRKFKEELRFRGQYPLFLREPN